MASISKVEGVGRLFDYFDKYSGTKLSYQSLTLRILVEQMLENPSSCETFVSQASPVLFGFEHTEHPNLLLMNQMTFLILRQIHKSSTKKHTGECQELLKRL